MMESSTDKKHFHAATTTIFSADEKHTSTIATTTISSVYDNEVGKMAQGDVAEEWKPSRQIKLIVMGQIFVVFAISLDMTILTATLPVRWSPDSSHLKTVADFRDKTVAEALGANTTTAFWIAASYLLANAVVQPIMASLADIFGRRSVTFASLTLFTLGSIICSVANSVTTMLAGRIVQGLGGGGILAVNLIIMSDLIPLRVRPKYISLQQLIVSVGFNIAPIIGGALVKVTTWRWLFYINLPFCACGLAIIPFVLKYQRPESTMGERLGSVDWIGSVSFVIGMTSLLVGLTWSGSQFAWSSAASLVPIILGLAVVFATGLYERYLAKRTFLRLALFNSWSAIAIYFCTVLQALTLFTEVYFLCLYLMGIKGYSPLSAGTYLLAFCAIAVPTSGIVGPMIARVGSYRWAIWSGWTVNTLALGLLTLLNTDTPTFAWVLLFITAGLGQGILFIAHSVACQAACKQKDAAHANAMYSFMRSLGLCLGVSLGATIFQNYLAPRLIDAGVPVDIAASAETYLHTLKTMADSPAKSAIYAAFARALQLLFATMCGISGLGLLTAVGLIKAHSLDQGLESEHKLEGPTAGLGVGRKSSIASYTGPI